MPGLYGSGGGGGAIRLAEEYLLGLAVHETETQGSHSYLMLGWGCMGGQAMSQGGYEGQPEAGEQPIQHLEAGAQPMTQALPIHQHGPRHPVHILWQVWSIATA